MSYYNLLKKTIRGGIS